MPRLVLIGLLTLGVILIVLSRRNARGPYGNILLAAGVAVIVLTGALRLILGG